MNLDELQTKTARAIDWAVFLILFMVFVSVVLAGSMLAVPDWHPPGSQCDDAQPQLRDV